MVRTLAALAVLSSASAFRAAQRSPQRPASSLRALDSEDFRRSLLAETERPGADGAVRAGIAKMDFVATSWEETPTETAEEARAQELMREQEKFRRSLLEAKLAYDAVDAALGTPAKEPAPVSEPEPAASAKTAEEAKAPKQEKFQRSLLEARLAYDAIDAALGASVSESEPAASAKTTEEAKALKREKFQRSLLEARLAYDAKAPEQKKFQRSLLAEAVGDVGGVNAAAPEPAATVAASGYVYVAGPAVPEPVVPVKPPKAIELAIVPVNESNVQFAAGALGAAAGLALGGPALAAVAAALCNYLSRKDGDGPSTGASAKTVVDAAARTAILAYNLLAQFDRDHKVVEATLELAERAADKAREEAKDGGGTLATVESALGGIASKVEELNEEYDLVGGAGIVLEGVGAVVETCVDKGLELNDEYKLADRAGDVVKGAVDKVTDKVTVKLQ